MMKRLAMAAFLLLAVTTARVEAGSSLPKAKSVIDRDTASHTTPYIRGTRKVPEPVRDESRTTHRDLHQTHAVRAK
jgi:hypothetical protein